MATNPADVFAPLRVSGPKAPGAPASINPADVFAPLRIPGTESAPIRRNPVAPNSLGEEFIAGLGQGVNSLQASLFGVAGLMGRELGISWLEDAGNAGAERNFAEAAETGRQSGGFTDIESAGGFFKWAAASLGEAIPSLASAFTGAGIGVIIGRKSLELGVKRSLARRVERHLAITFGFDEGAALESARGLMNSKTGQQMLAKAYTGRSGRVISAASRKATRKGAAIGVFAVSALPQIGQIDQELINAGIAEPGLTALLGGIVGGALEAVPALRLLDKMFPGVDRQVSKQFVKDFAIATGTQLALEGSTEAAQELIQLASLAYHDPTFDMFSPDAKKRVIDAFAAGALVGAITGGGAQAIGNIGPAARDVKKVAAPKIEAWSMDVRTGLTNLKQQAEDKLPEGFVPADNTVFQEIRDRIYATIQPTIEAAVNSARNQFQTVSDKLDASMEGGLNAETASFGELVAAAHKSFIKDHQQQIDDAKAFVEKQTKFIVETAAQIKDPAQRAKFIDDHVSAVKEKLSGWLNTLRQDSAKRDQKLEAEIDNMDFPDDVVDAFEEQDREEAEQAAVGEVDAAPALVFGKFQKTPTPNVSGKEEVAGYDTREQAEQGLATLRKQFPESTDTDFEIIEQTDGTFLIETVNPELRVTHRFNQAIQAARDSASRTKNNDRNLKRKFQLPIRLIKKLGLKMKKPVVDIITLANRGRNLDPNAKSLRDGLQAMVGDMLARGYLDTDSANAMLEQFDEHFGDVAETDGEVFAPVGSFLTRGVAMREMINFINALKKRGFRVPRNLFGPRENEDGTWGYGIDNPSLYRALRAKDQKMVVALDQALKDQRRQDKLAAETKEFAGNVTLEEGGDIGDTRGFTAGLPRTRVTGRVEVNTLPVRTGEVDAEGNPILEFGRSEPIEGAVTEDTDPQQDDPATDPKNLPTERSLQPKAPEGSSKQSSEEDLRILKTIGRTSKVKVLFGNDSHTDGALTKAVKDLVTFVQKKLGLANDIIVMDDKGLQLLISSGAVTDPAFQETLENPNVNARNIRIGDKSYIYLSSKVLENDHFTVLSIGHELGHHLFSVAWNNLTFAAQTRLHNAFLSTTEGQGLAEDGQVSRDSNDPDGEAQDIITFDVAFNEWMADQLAAWITTRRAPKGAVEAFFAKVGGQIRRLYQFMHDFKTPDRFTLNEDFASFADAVAEKARVAESPGANPLSDVELRFWFKDAGVTMYKFFGKLPTIENMSDLVPRTEVQQQALDRILKNYPAVVKRAVTLRNWIVKAYSVAVAPSTGVVRSIGLRIKAANEFVTIFNRERHGEAKLGSNYHQRSRLAKAQFVDGPDGYATIMGDTSVERKAEIAQSLQAKDSDPNATFTKEEQAVRDLFDRMHAYATKLGLPVRKVTNYFPRTFSRKSLIDNKQKILDHLTDGKGIPLEKARSLYNSLLSPDAADGRATLDVTETPSFTAMNSRKTGEGIAGDPFFDQFLDDNLDGVVHNYINSLVKRAEFNRALGEAMPVTELDAKAAIAAGIWDPKAKLNRMMADAKKQGATDQELVILEQYVDANLGQLGRDSVFAQPGVRRWMAGMMAYQNLRVLLFTVFASLPDLAGPAIRAGDMRLAFKSIKDNMHDLAKTDGDLAIMARTLGIINSIASEHVMTEYVDNHHMPATARKWNEAFFKWTGLNWYTDLTRKMALAVGIDYIQQQAQFMKDGDEKQAFKARDRLAELGITEAQVDKWVAAGRPAYDSQAHKFEGDEFKVAEALIQFVDESIMRPNASQRPLLASHPGMMLMYHLKGYLYAVHDITLKRIAFNIKESDNPAQLAAAISPAIAMLLLTAVGLELRELIQYAGSNRKPPTDRMDGWEYMWELFQRSGLSGIYQLGIDLEGAEDRGLSHVAGVLGPTFSQAAQVLSRPSTQTIPKAIPIVGQIPAARAVVRNVIR